MQATDKECSTESQSGLLSRCEHANRRELTSSVFPWLLIVHLQAVVDPGPHAVLKGGQ